MKRSAVLAFAILPCCVVTSANDPPKRPRIFGIAYVKILVTNTDKARDFYDLALRSIPSWSGLPSSCDWCERIPVSSGLGKKRLGPIELQAIPVRDSPSFLSEIAFRTDDVKKLRNYLLKNHIAAENLSKCGEDPCFGTVDPEGHGLCFVQRSGNPPVEITGASVPTRPPIIHAGFVVHDRAAEDRFYRDLLGFLLYWYGGVKDTETNWVDMQVPDGTDWIEYMLNVSPNADHRTLGVMNHIALGVPDIQVAHELLLKNGWKPGEEPKIGRDGKWQLNLYDPDGTRVEFMELTPVQRPCCSEYAGPHPGQYL